MDKPVMASTVRLVNGSTGDPVVYLDYPGRHDALLLDAGDNSGLAMSELADLAAVFVTHHHIDHFIGLDRIVRANLDQDKTLRIHGPTGTIRKVYDRVKSYEHPFFPFQKLVLDVREHTPPPNGCARRALLECARRFPEPVVQETPWDGPMVYENDLISVHAAFGDHTVPVMAYAVIEKTGYHLAPEKLHNGPLRPGSWIGEVLTKLRNAAGEPRALDEIVTIGGGGFRLGDLANQYFESVPARRIAFITDTAWTPAVSDGLLALAKKATRLYCDAFYAQAQAAQAKKHRHLTAALAGQIAREAQVKELVLIHFASRYAGRYHLLLEEAQAVFPNTSADIPPATTRDR